VFAICVCRSRALLRRTPILHLALLRRTLVLVLLVTLLCASLGKNASAASATGIPSS
jgi:hypothetical protein